MARTTDARTLSKMIDGLRSQRADLVARLERIDETFHALGIAVDGAVRHRGPGRRGKPGPKPGRRRRKRGSFAVSGEKSVLDFVKRHGKPNAADVNKHWQGEGRGGKADNTLSRLVKTKVLKRVEVKGERGSRYTVA